MDLDSALAAPSHYTSHHPSRVPSPLTKSRPSLRQTAVNQLMTDGAVNHPALDDGACPLIKACYYDAMEATPAAVQLSFSREITPLERECGIQRRATVVEDDREEAPPDSALTFVVRSSVPRDVPTIGRESNLISLKSDFNVPKVIRASQLETNYGNNP